MAVERLAAAFRRARGARRAALIAYLTAGYPSLAATAALVRELARAGVDIIELGLPFSDPLADGPTIQAASAQALKRGVTLERILRTVAEIRKTTDVPLVAMGYANPLYRRGLPAFCRQAVAAGFDGVIVPDLPPEEAGELIRAARPVKLATIFLAAPTSPPARLRRIAAASRGFVYVVSLTGVTGARRQLPREVVTQVRALRRLTRQPIAVGFGVSTPAQVRWLSGVADGVIVGSALVDAIRKRALPTSIGRWVRPFVEATRR
ncbi:MAG: tryptophan synthase subunit alpha [Candidatus Omnitrophica bacterium]|nr:tryptophan synthase subunit alpha [Candidatus Omnitrophota bacterium]